MNYKVGAKKVFGKNWDGLLYESGNKEKIIIVFTGSDGGLQHAGKSAKYLIDNGIPALALEYFRTKHTKKSIDRIPLELIEDAVQYLKWIGYQHIGIEGLSKGAELAFAAAVQFPVFFTVIVKTPSWFYSEGLVSGQPSGHSCWIYQSKEIPFTPYNKRKFYATRMILKAHEYNILPINTGKKVADESVIPVEKIKAPILMFSTKVDTIWPSEESCEKIMQRLRENEFKYQYKHVSFDHMGHMMMEYCGKEIKYFIKSEKEDPEACYRERAEMGRIAVEWINSSLML